MFVLGRLLVIVAAIVLICGSLLPVQGAARDQLTGVVIGRSGEILYISVPQTVREGTLFTVRLLENEDPIAAAKVSRCTSERPYIAMARVIEGDSAPPVPIGVHAYADLDSVGDSAPKPMKFNTGPGRQRFSIQAGAFYPRTESLREDIGDYWEAYRLNYSMLRVGAFETLLSTQYMSGTGTFMSNGTQVRRTMEMIPVSVLGRLRPFRLGGSHLYLGAGVGNYRVRTQDKVGTTTTTTDTNEMGQEYSIGLESKRGWVLELRYTDVDELDIQGYSLTMGARF